VHLTREDSDFSGRTERWVPDDIRAINLGSRKTLNKGFSRFVVSDNTNKYRLRVQSSDVDCTVGSPAGCRFSFFIAKNQNRSLSRDAGNAAVKKLIGDKVADNENPVLGKAANDRR